ncbi:hypothetical protein [Pontibacter fetidus]|uniref:Glycosyltransferase RgtA/B/C/D-like domain-containing protein n=1 Tax=Pontibacter fetidus TaxID=2700082 RepID=A0A6B2H423_9BACT|nr:hypothetical protein [Pontibacter fetidus]NDK57191.1 hypothetical protein [Pontibacter fetidus]
MHLLQHNTLKEDLLLATVGVALLSVCLWDGIGITFDSHLYLLGSTYLQQHGFTDLFTVPAFRTKPPVLSALYALLQNNIQLIKLSNLLFLAGTLLVNFKLATILIDDLFFRRLTKAVLASATPFMLVHSFLWSEPFFLFVLSVYFLLSYHALLHTHKTAWLYVLPVLGLLLVGLRHIGVVYVLCSGVYVLMHYKYFSRKQLMPIILNVLLPVLALLWWHTQVVAHSGDAGEYNLIRNLNLQRNFLVYADVLKVWLAPPGLPFPEVLAIVAFIGYAIVAWLAVRQSYGSKARHLVLLFLLTSGGYAGLMLLKGDLLTDDNERYLSLVYAPLTILLFYVLQNRMVTINRKLVWLFFIVWFAYPLARTLYNVNRWRQHGINTYNPAAAPKAIISEFKSPK